MIVVGIIGLLAALAVPNFFKARERARTNTCINNLRLIDGAKQQWASEHNKTATDTPDETSLVPYIGRPGSQNLPKCADGAAPYVLNDLKTPPECPNSATYPNHYLPN